MSSSPQRNRKPPMHPGVQGSMQGIAPRESTPSPSFRERQRAVKAHSLPIVPSVNQLLANQNQQSIYPQGQQPSPTMSNSSHQSRKSPPPTARISPVAAKTTIPAHGRERSPERVSPPPLVHSLTQPVLPHLVPLPPPGPQHTQSQPNVHVQNPHHPRPINRVPPPQFLTQYQGADEKWQVTEQLIAEFERADMQQAQAQYSHPAGTSGVAYAGGAASNSVNVHMQLAMSTGTKDPAMERVRANDRSSPKEPDSSSSQAAKRQIRDKDVQNARESPRTRDRSQTVSSISSLVEGRTPEYRGSPQYQTPMASPGERTAAYGQYIPDGFQAGASQGPTPPARKPVTAAEAAATRVTPPAASKLAASSHTPPLQAMAARSTDRSLPVQEEPEEDVGHYIDGEPEYEDRHHGSPTPSSDVYPETLAQRYDTRREDMRGSSHTEEDDDQTLNEEIETQHQPGKDSEGSESGSGFTPRSPLTNLPERPRELQYQGPNGQYPPSNGQYSPSSNGQYSPSNGQYAQTNAEYQKTVRVKHRSGSTDQLGLRSFDPAMFERTMESLRGSGQDSPVNGQRQSQPLPQPPVQQQQQQQQLRQSPLQTQAQSHLEAARQQAEVRQFAMSRLAEQKMAYAGIHPSQLAHPEDWQNLLDDPTSSYLRAYLQTPGSRPNAPVPPTPQSQTAAPSPSPLISAMQSEAEPRQVGSPYPYPFTHIRRSHVTAPPAAPSSSYDMNNPAVIREQIALQMQIYALNNGLAPPSDSTFSPPATPFPGANYNPWAFVPMNGINVGAGAHGQGHGGEGGAGGTSAMSIRSSPSHEPVQLPPPPAMRGRGLRRRETGSLRAPQGGTGGRGVRRMKPPPRVESTQPRETSPEPSSGSGSGEETAGEERFTDRYVAEGGAEWAGRNGAGGEDDEEEDEGVWVDEEEEGEEEDLLELEFHPSYINNAQKRKRRWETRWDALTQAFQLLDRETDATLVMLAAPPHSSKLHALTSRSIRRDPALLASPKLLSLRRAFSHLATQRRSARSSRITLVERLQLSNAGSASSSPGGVGGESRESDLRRALEAALGSLGEMGKIYEQREVRWRDEMRQLTEDRDRVEMLLRQTLGPVLGNLNMNGGGRG